MEEIEERLFAIRGAARKYQWRRMLLACVRTSKLAALDGGSASVPPRSRYGAARNAYRESAVRLSTRRAEWQSNWNRPWPRIRA
jgi:DNA repair ATPase RecN